MKLASVQFRLGVLGLVACRGSAIGDDKLGCRWVVFCCDIR